MQGEERMKLRPPPLKINNNSSSGIKKPPTAPLRRQPVIIHTYSPKVIHADSENFMWLVQRLTGSTDTRLRCKKSRPQKRSKSKFYSTGAVEGNLKYLSNDDQQEIQEDQDEEYKPSLQMEDDCARDHRVSPKSPLTDYVEEAQNSAPVDPFQQSNSAAAPVPPVTPGWSPIPTPNFLLQQEFLKDLPFLSPSIFSASPGQQFATAPPSWPLRH